MEIENRKLKVEKDAGLKTGAEKKIMEDEKINNKQSLRVIENMHQTFLEALRHREQEILQFIAFLAPALGGFIWLIKVYLENTELKNAFVFGTVGVLLILTLGAVYAIAIGFNFRYITFQIAKIESKLEITDFMLKGWIRTTEAWVYKYKNKKCYPPEIIKVFWLAFIIAELFVAITAGSLLYVTQKHACFDLCVIFLFIVVCFIISAFCSPSYYGGKLFALCLNEKEFKIKDTMMRGETNIKDSEFYEPYASFSRIMRAWLVAYGIGAPALLASQDAFKAILAVPNQAMFIISCFLFGASVQIIAAFIYKYSMGYIYFEDLGKVSKKTNRYKIAEWFSEAMWLEMLFDIISIGSFALATVKVLMLYVQRG